MKLASFILTFLFLGSAHAGPLMDSFALESWLSFSDRLRQEVKMTTEQQLDLLATALQEVGQQQHLSLSNLSNVQVFPHDLIYFNLSAEYVCRYSVYYSIYYTDGENFTCLNKRDPSLPPISGHILLPDKVRNVPQTYVILNPKLGRTERTELTRIDGLFSQKAGLKIEKAPYKTNLQDLYARLVSKRSHGNQGLQALGDTDEGFEHEKKFYIDLWQASGDVFSFEPNDLKNYEFKRHFFNGRANNAYYAIYFKSTQHGACLFATLWMSSSGNPSRQAEVRCYNKGSQTLSGVYNNSLWNPTLWEAMAMRIGSNEGIKGQLFKLVNGVFHKVKDQYEEVPGEFTKRQN